MTTKLEAVNTLLESIGEAPVVTVTDSGLIEADLAVTMIDRVSKSTQKRGWHWNTLIDYPLAIDLSGNINLPATTLKVDSYGKHKHKDVVQRGLKLYDRDNNTFVFTETIQSEIVLNLDFEDLPEAAKDFIMLSASRRFQQKHFGSSELSQFDREDEQTAYGHLLDAESDSSDFNMLTGSASVLRIVNRKYFNKD